MLKSFGLLSYVKLGDCLECRRHSSPVVKAMTCVAVVLILTMIRLQQKKGFVNAIALYTTLFPTSFPTPNSGIESSIFTHTMTISWSGPMPA